MRHRRGTERSADLTVAGTVLLLLAGVNDANAQTFDTSERDYEVFSGDFNGDSRIDIYVREVPEIVFGKGTGVFDPDGAGMDEVRVVPWLLASLQTATQPAPTPLATAQQHVTVNPLPGAWINKKDWAPPATCGTSDGRFDTGTKYRGTPHLGVDLGGSIATPVVVGTDSFAKGRGRVDPQLFFQWALEP